MPRYMTYFFSKQRLGVVQEEMGMFRPLQIEAIPPGDDKNINSNFLYFTIGDNLRKIMSGIQDEESRKSIFLVEDVKINNFPIEISKEKKLDHLFETHKSDKINIAIINGMSMAAGDHIVGMSALNNLYDKLKERYSTSVNIDLYQEMSPNIVALNKKYNCIRNFYFLPSQFTHLLQYNAYIDLAGICSRPDFDIMHMNDFYLEHIGLNPENIPPEKKRSSVKVNEQTIDKLDKVFEKIKGDNKILLFHHKASTDLRSIPDHFAKDIVKKLIKATDYTIISTVPNFYMENDRFINVSGLSNNFDDFIYLISKADKIITTDTCVYHISDSFDIPTIVLFTSIDPDLRAKYYPHCKPMNLVDQFSTFKGRHGSSNDLDLVSIRKTWSKNLDNIATFCIDNI